MPPPSWSIAHCNQLYDQSPGATSFRCGPTRPSTEYTHWRGFSATQLCITWGRQRAYGEWRSEECPARSFQNHFSIPHFSQSVGLSQIVWRGAFYGATAPTTGELGSATPK